MSHVVALFVVGWSRRPANMEAKACYESVLDQLEDTDSESEVERIFLGTPKQSEAKFREVANLLHTVRPASKASVITPNDERNTLPTGLAPSPSAIRPMTTHKELTKQLPLPKCVMRFCCP
jgi:hypothetical protein